MPTYVLPNKLVIELTFIYSKIIVIQLFKNILNKTFIQLNIKIGSWNIKKKISDLLLKHVITLPKMFLVHYFKVSFPNVSEL